LFRTLPPTRLTPTAGSVQGQMKVRSDSEPLCESALQMRDVKYAPNPQLVRSRDEYDSLQRQLEGRVKTGEFKGCGTNEKPAETHPRAPGEGGPVRYASTLAAFTTSFNEQATADAPPEVRAAVARDTYALTGRAAANAVLNDVTSQLTNELAGKIGGQTGKLLQGAAGTQPSQRRNVAPNSDDNAVAKGAKSIGNGIKRLFGGGKKPPSNSTTKGK
jgi:hypothetical protein